MNTQPEIKKIRGIDLKIYRIASLALVAVAVLFRTLNLFFFYEADIGYYAQGAVLPTVFRLLLIVATALFAVYAGILSEKPSPAPKTTVLSSVAALIVGATFAVTALLRYCRSVTEMTRLDVFLFATGGLAAVYFILLGLHKRPQIPALVTGFGAILWFGCILVSAYFDVTVPMNAPEKLVLLLACLGGMLLMLGETRMACSVPKSRFYLFALSAGTLYLCVSAIPSLIADAAGILNARDLGYADFACLALGLFGVVRLIMPFAHAEEATDKAISEQEVSDEAESESTDTPAT